MALQLRTKLINEKKQHGLNASICFKIKDLIILERDQVSICQEFANAGSRDFRRKKILNTI